MEENVIAPKELDKVSIKAHNKYRSRRWIVTVWSMFMVTAITIISMITGDERFAMLAVTLAAEPLAYTSLETIKKDRTPRTQ